MFPPPYQLRHDTPFCTSVGHAPPMYPTLARYAYVLAEVGMSSTCVWQAAQAAGLLGDR
jgi:hypothetical protein